MKQLIRVHADERIDMPDFEAVGGLLELYDQLRTNEAIWLPTGRGTGAFTLPTETRIFKGFDIYDISTSTCKLRRGSGLLKLLDQGELKMGIVAGGIGEEYQVIDVSGWSNGDYWIAIRVLYTDAEMENRVHWNVGGTPAEYVDFVATRQSLVWQWTYSSTGAAPPTSDWVVVAKLTVAAGVISASADQRHLFFEGDAIAGAGQWEPEWGDGANDRDAARGAYGIGDLHLWVQAVRRQLRDIILDTGGWYGEPNIALNQVEAEHYGYPTDANSGLHKYVTLGPATQRHRLQSVDANTWRVRSMDQADEAELQFLANGATGACTLAIVPRGTGMDLSDGDIFTLWVGKEVGTPDFKLMMTRSLSTKYSFGFYAAALQPVTIRSGTAWAYGERGVQVNELLASFHVGKLTRNMMIPLELGMGGSWTYNGAADVTGNLVRVQTTVANDTCWIEIRSFPEGSKLTKIQVMWEQSGVASSRQMRMYAARHSQPVGYQTDGDVTDGSEWTISTLVSAGNPYIEWVHGATDVNIKTFTVDNNNTGWSKENDKLVLGFYSGDSALTYQVHSVRLYWEYSDINFFPVDT